MRYDISKASAPAMPNLGKGTECIKILSKRPQITCMGCFFRYFTPFLAHMSAAQKFSIPTSFARKLW